MAIETQPEKAQPSGRGPAEPRPVKSLVVAPAVHTGLIGAVIGYFLGHLLGNFLSSGYAQNLLSDSNDVPIVLGYAFATIGWLAGLGVFNDLLRAMTGKPLRDVHQEEDGAERGFAKYFRFTTNHKIVGIQYLYGMIAYFLTGGLFAMAIRTELLSPSYHIMGPSSTSWWWASTAP